MCYNLIKVKNNVKILLLISILILGSLAFFGLSKTKKSPPSSKPFVITTPIPISMEPMTTSKPSSATMKVNIYFIALNDNGKSGPKVGCGDSVVAIQKTLPSTKAPLSAVLTDLLSLNTQYYGENRLYNALYQSNLRLYSVIINPQGKTIIKLSGGVKLGGVCEGPRIIAQLRQTAFQFPSVKEVTIYLNDKLIEEAFSAK